ncbi:MAG: hypothetical protein HYZ89_07300 [Candidatus Omnitrophica bacterium]|nr:hypothetical protein [Candidatus Omnitrophota bacterium]
MWGQLRNRSNKHRVRYCIVGAYAVAFHARPRYTKDLDVFIEPSLKNGERITAALKAFGFGELRLAPEDFVQPGQFIQLGYEPVRVDLITSLAGFTFEQVWRHRAVGNYGKVRAFFIGRDELIRNKELSGRRQDQADLEKLHPSRRRSLKRRTR